MVALLRNGSTDFYEIFFVHLLGMRIGRKIFFTLLGLTRGGAQKGDLEIYGEIVVYKWLLLVIGEIISRN